MAEEIKPIPLLDSAALMPMRKWRCTRGHTWEAPMSIIGVQFMDFPELGIESDEAKFCMRCCYEWLREYCGKVREVK